jgi:hypothetical protein
MTQSGNRLIGREAAFWTQAGFLGVFDSQRIRASPPAFFDGLVTRGVLPEINRLTGFRTFW